MESTELIEKIQALTDLELAILLSLVAGQHCLIETEPDSIQLAFQELQLVSNDASHNASAKAGGRSRPMALDSQVQSLTAPNP